jgi:hypothetical protein
MRRIFTLAALFLISLAAKAQIRGTVQDRDLNGIAAATVTLTAQNDSNNVARTVTDSSGAYQFTGTPAGKYVLRVEALNYQEKVSIVTANDTAATIADVFVDIQGKDLAGVTVIASAPPVVVKGDTSQFSASQYKVNPDATTEDLIKKMPGITVAKDGTVTAQGETVKKVTIDGKDFFGDDASAALKNLPSEVVDKIQVFDKLSDQAQLTGFDDGNSVKAINVVTKSGIKNGRFGRIYAGYGTDDRYAAGGNASFFKGNRRISIVGNFNNINQQNFGAQDLLGVTSSSGGGGGRGGNGRGGGGGGDFNVGQTSGISKTNALGINFSNQYGTKATLTGSYFFNNSRNTNQSLTNTENLLSNDTANLFQRQSGNSLTNNTNHRINLRFEYKFDSSNSLFIIPSVNIQKNNSNSNSGIFSYYGVPGDGKLLDTSYTYNGLNSNDRTGFNIRNNILFRHAFAKKGRSLSLGFNVAFTRNDGEAINNSIYHFFDPLKDSLQNQFNDNTTNGHTIGGTIAYTEPVGKRAQIQFDYNPSVQKNTADQQTFSFDGQKYSQFDPLLSNKFDNTITTNNGGVTYRFTPNKDQQFSAGVSYQNSKLQSDRIFPTQTSVNQSFSTFLPNLMWRKKLSTKSNIRIFYRASTNFPSVNQLQDVVNLTNPLRVSSGNPLLKQSYTQFVAGRYQYTDSKTGQSFFANLFLQTASNYISNATYIPSADSAIQNGIVLQKGSQFTKPVNLDGYNSVRTFFTYSLPVKSLKTVVNLNAGYAYSRLPGLSNNVKIITNNNVYNAGVVLASNISEYVDFNLSYSANFNQTSGSASGINNYVYQNAGAQVNLLNKKGWFLQNDVNYQANSGLGDGLNQKYALWNAAIGKKFLPNHVGELKLSVFDLLGQNQSIVRTVTENYIQDVQSVVLQRYFMLTFTYNLKNFGVAATKGGRSNTGGEQGRPQLPMGGTPGGGPGGPGF